MDYVTANRRAIQSGRLGYGPRVDETPKDLAREVDRGASDRTPALALTGVVVVVGAVVLVIAGVALVLYLVFK